MCNSSYRNNSIVYHPSLITKDKDFSQTLKGEIFIGINHNKFEDQYLMDEPVAIKKMYNQCFIILIRYYVFCVKYRLIFSFLCNRV